jgi:hypothetical protein
MGAEIFRVRGIVVIMGRILLAWESESQEQDKTKHCSNLHLVERLPRSCPDAIAIPSQISSDSLEIARHFP